MRTVLPLLAFALLACEKDPPTPSTDPAAAPAAPSATAANAAPAADPTGAPAAGGGGGAVPVAVGVAGNATVGTPNKGVMANDGGVRIVDGTGKEVTIDGGALTLKNSSGTGSVTQTDAGMVLKGKSGKTLTIPPVPGLQ